MENVIEYRQSADGLGFLSHMGKAVASLFRYRRLRSEMNDLLHMDDKILKDIGVTRDQIHHEIWRMRRNYLF